MKYHVRLNTGSALQLRAITDDMQWLAPFIDTWTEGVQVVGRCIKPSDRRNMLSYGFNETSWE